MKITLSFFFTDYLLQVCNESLLRINRYKLSSSSDFFVPNKILHEDFVAFIKELPTFQNYEAFNLSENTEILRQEEEATNLIKTFNLSSNNQGFYQDQAISDCEGIKKLIPSEVQMMESLSSKHSTFVLKEQIEIINNLIRKVNDQVSALDDQLMGKQTLDLSSETFLKDVNISKVPDSWMKLLDLSTRNINTYLETLSTYSNYFRKDAFESNNKYWIKALRNPNKLLTALIYEFSIANDCSIDDVEVYSTIHCDEPEINKYDSFIITGLTIVSANIDFENRKLIPAQHKSHKQSLPFVKIQLRRKRESIEKGNKEIFYECPVYETNSRLNFF